MPVCTEHGCPEIIPASGHCPAHARARDAARGTPTARGYDQEHRQQRQAWAPRVAAGTVACAKCGHPITPAQPWDLGHTDDRSTWTGPEHRTCNRAHAGRRAHR